MPLSRREWFLATLASGALARYAFAAPRLEFFDPESASIISLIAGQIIPSTDGPGAQEAGVVYFIDRALRTTFSDRQDEIRKGIADFHATCAKLYPGLPMDSLTGSQRLELVRAIEHSDFFETVRVATIAGFLSNPSYGGNQGQAGWKLIGFEDRMVWTQPFGFYDAETR